MTTGQHNNNFIFLKKTLGYTARIICIFILRFMLVLVFCENTIL